MKQLELLPRSEEHTSELQSAAILFRSGIDRQAPELAITRSANIGGVEHGGSSRIELHHEAVRATPSHAAGLKGIDRGKACPCATAYINVAQRIGRNRGHLETAPEIRSVHQGRVDYQRARFVIGRQMEANFISRPQLIPADDAL